MTLLASITEENLPILKKSRCPSGIYNLDLLLEGGYLKAGLIMMVGPTGMEKNAFAFHFAESAVKNNELVIYVVSDMNYEELLKKASALGFDLKKPLSSGNLIFIDCYSSTSENALRKSEPMKEVLSLPGPSALNDLSLALKGVLQDNQQKQIRVIFHSLSTFVLYNPADSIVKFLQLIGGRLKKADATTMFLVEEGMHEKTLLTSLEHMMDELYTVHDSHNFSIESPNLPLIVPLKLGSAGIELR